MHTDSQYTSRRGGKVSVLVVLLLVAIPVIAVAGGLYVRDHTKRAEAEAADRQAHAAMVVSGLAAPVTNRLDARFADADGNLVADPPADPKQLVDPDPLVFSYIAAEGAAEQAAAWQPLVDHLARATGRRVVYDAALTDVKEQVRALRDGKLHVTGLNAGTVPRAVNGSGFVPVAMLPGDDGSGMTRMRIIAPAGSPLRTPADLKGQALGLTQPSSNSGFKAAVVLLRADFGLLPGRDYEIRYSGGHERSIGQVKNGRVPAAAVADDMLARAVAAGEISPAEYRSVYESERFPTAALGHAHTLNKELAAKVAAALLSFDWKGTAMEKELGAAHTRLVPADFKNHWSLIRRIDDETGTNHAVN